MITGTYVLMLTKGEVKCLQHIAYTWGHCLLIWIKKLKPKICVSYPGGQIKNEEKIHHPGVSSVLTEHLPPSRLVDFLISPYL
jgi:hypothetical protein